MYDAHKASCKQITHTDKDPYESMTDIMAALIQKMNLASYQCILDYHELTVQSAQGYHYSFAREIQDVGG